MAGVQTCALPIVADGAVVAARLLKTATLGRHLQLRPRPRPRNARPYSGGSGAEDLLKDRSAGGEDVIVRVALGAGAALQPDDDQAGAERERQCDGQDQPSMRSSHGPRQKTAREQVQRRWLDSLVNECGHALR